MSNLEDNSKYAVPGKTIIIFFTLGFIICLSALAWGFYSKMEINHRDKIAKEINEKEYLEVQSQVEKFVADKDYVHAVTVLQNFVKKFTYKNEYKEAVEQQIEELKLEAKREMTDE